MQFDFIEKNLSCATIPNFLFKVAYNSAAIIISCVVFVIWNQPLSHVAGKRKKYQSPGVCGEENIYTVFKGNTVNIQKQRHYFANKGPSSQSYGFSSGRVDVRVGL